jgi:hypothetical protein
MRRILQVIIAASVVAAASVVPSVSAETDHKNKYSDNVTVERICKDQNGEEAGRIIYTGPVKLWPPNHKYNTATVTARDEDDGDMVTLTTSATHDQYDADTGAEQNGSGNTADDITPAADTDVSGTGTATQNFQIRAERSGQDQTGRTYTITTKAVFTDSDGDNSSDDENTCTPDPFIITVPHDMRPSNR